MFGGVLIRAIKHIALGLRERVLVAHVSLRKQRKHCADGVARGGDKAAGCQDVGDAPAANPRCAHRRRCAGIGLVAMVVIGMRSPPPIHYPSRRKSVSAALWQARATRGTLPASALHVLPARGNQASLEPRSKLGGFDARFAVSTAYQTQLQLLSVSHQPRFQAIRFTDRASA